MECERDIQLGEDALAVEEGVVGYRGLVPLEKPLWFCSVRCIAVHFQDEQRHCDSARYGVATNTSADDEHYEENDRLK